MSVLLFFHVNSIHTFYLLLLLLLFFNFFLYFNSCSSNDKSSEQINLSCNGNINLNNILPTDNDDSSCSRASSHFGISDEDDDSDDLSPPQAILPSASEVTSIASHHFYHAHHHNFHPHGHGHHHHHQHHNHRQQQQQLQQQQQSKRKMHKTKLATHHYKLRDSR